MKLSLKFLEPRLRRLLGAASFAIQPEGGMKRANGVGRVVSANDARDPDVGSRSQ